MARTFAGGSNEYLGFTPRTWDAWNGFTIAAMIRNTATGDYDTLYYSGAIGGLVNGEIQFGIDGPSNDLYLGIGGTSRTWATTIAAGYQIVAATKATGTATPVGHSQAAPFTGAWSRANMTGTLANPATTAQACEEIGRWNGGNNDPMDGDIEWLGIWNFGMSNAEVESLPHLSPDRLANTFPGCQRFYWFNQPVSDTVRDLSNHLADQTARTGTTHTMPPILFPNRATTPFLIAPGIR